MYMWFPCNHHKFSLQGPVYCFVLQLFSQHNFLTYPLERHCTEYCYRSAEQGKLTILLSAFTVGIVRGWKIPANAFCKCCRKNIQLKCASRHSFCFCYAYLRINFGSSKEKGFEQLKVEGKQSVVGQVMAAGRNICLLVNQLQWLQAHLFCNAVLLLLDIVSRKVVLPAGKGTDLCPWLYHGFLYKIGLLHYLKLCPDFCLDIRTVVAH